MTRYQDLPAVLASALLMAASAVTAQQTETPSTRVVLILDSSGSMWGQVRGRAKIEISREVIHGLLDDWDIEAPTRVTARDQFEVRWQEPASQGDLIVLVERSTADGRYYTSSDYSPLTSIGSPVTLRALPNPGAYEMRYLAEGDGILARTSVEIVAGN